MSAKSAPSAAPAWAITCWTDSTHIYTEIPGKDGRPPYVQSWALTEGGLSKALEQMKGIWSAIAPIQGDYKIPLNTLIKTAVPINNFTTEERSAIRDILRKQGII